jgi:(R,R)-butanediol dehydrogenase/meso-butanediol dehydrogenase/diacetyl reductase
MSLLPDSHTVAVNAGGGNVDIESRPAPNAEPGRVVIEVSHCGICGSDIHMILESWGRPGTVHGHEYSGTIVAVAEGEGVWSVGDEVVAGAGPRCGQCERCLAGEPAQCEQRDAITSGDYDGAYARFVSLDVGSLLRIPDGLGMREAALAEPLAVALHAIKRSGIATGESAIVFGAGPIGALIVATLVAEGIGPLTVVEPAPPRQELARRIGADNVITPDEVPTFGIHQPEEISPIAVHVVFECSGKKSAMEAGLMNTRRGGRFIFVGAGIEPPSVDANRVLLNEIIITGSYASVTVDFEESLALLASGRLPTDELIDATDVPVDGIEDALLDLAAGKIAGKVMVVPSELAKKGTS